MSNEIFKLYMKYYKHEIKKDIMPGKLYFISDNNEFIFVDKD